PRSPSASGAAGSTRLPKTPTASPFMPHALSASRTHAPAGSSMVTTSTRSRCARTTSTRMELIGAPRKGVDHGVGDLVEQRLEQLAERAACELVAHREGDLAGIVGERREAPGGGELRERALDEAHIDGGREVVLVPRGK